jgi:anti-sigma factor (TIGR02949 family)
VAGINGRDYLLCHDAFERLCEYLDGALPSEEEEAVRAHLDLCADCLSHFRFEERLLQRIRDKARAVRAPRRLREGIERLLEEL